MSRSRVPVKNEDSLSLNYKPRALSHPREMDGSNSYAHEKSNERIDIKRSRVVEEKQQTIGRPLVQQLGVVRESFSQNTLKLRKS